MGVTGLWTVLQPFARPVKLETLNKKRLAVDASIWIYQFLKAVRDKEGNALRNSHVVGFFRRIVKLLYFGIKPVFVFDGDAPALKRETIAGRKRRREGRREDAAATAGRILAVQMKRNAEEEVERERRERENPTPQNSMVEEEIPEDIVYVEELHMTAQERLQNRKFKKKDAYHLPDLSGSIADMGAPNDPRIMSTEELEEYARQFHTGEEINMYDFSKIDFNSPFFLSLPAEDRYNILNAARLRSRLRMGLSKEQLDSMFPDRMAFSRFQIERVAERNELTQRLMNINGMNDEQWSNRGARIAGEKGREYVLVKNDGVEGGWALGVVGGKDKDQGERSRPIDIERLEEAEKESEDDGAWDDDDVFEDVPIEGLNRLLKRPNMAVVQPGISEDYEMGEIAKRRNALYESRKENAGQSRRGAREPRVEDPNSLFIAEDESDNEWEDVNDPQFDNLFEGVDEDLNRAITMSLDAPSPVHETEDHHLDRAIAISLGQQPTEPGPSNKGKGRAVNWTQIAAPEPSGLAPEDSDDDDMDLQAVLNESRRIQAQRMQKSSELGASCKATPSSTTVASSSKTSNPFGGPLPFEKLDFSRSMLRKKKKPDEEAGGFEKEKDKAPAPLPPWFSGDATKGLGSERKLEDRDVNGGNIGPLDTSMHEFQALVGKMEKEVIDLDASDDEREQGRTVEDAIPIDSEVRMDDIADRIRAEPPVSEGQESRQPPRSAPERLPAAAERQESDEEPFDWEESDREEPAVQNASIRPPGGEFVPEDARSPSPEFEDIEMQDASTSLQAAQDIERESAPYISVGDTLDEEAFLDDDADQYSDPEDEELLLQLSKEAEEHARFASELNQKSQLQNAEDYERELKALRRQQKKDRRDADEVNKIMIIECQQLLKLFGLPYITAPMEAEAQCAELVRLGLVDGIVTDDSDTFLFGGTRVYKNMFNQAKFVECYLLGDLEKESSLNRENLIRMAHLLGSDYTDGIPGVGPVTALEILSEFSQPEGLTEFKEWLHRIQINPGKPAPEDVKTAFRKKFKRQASKIFLDPTFPDPRVDHAYLNPSVDSDPTPFEWGVPDLDALRGFLMSTIGWSQERTDEVLVPVIKDMNRRETEGTQANITRFFGGSVGVGAAQAFAPRQRVVKSKRMESALGRLGEQAKRKRVAPNTNDNAETPSSRSEMERDVDGGEGETAGAGGKKTPKPRKTHGSSVEVVSSGSGSVSGSDDYREEPRKVQKRTKASTRRQGKAKAKNGTA